MWTGPENAIVLTEYYGARELGALDVTSTSTIRYESLSGDWWYMMFDVGASTINAAFQAIVPELSPGAEDTAPTSTATEPDGETWLSYICFIQSASLPFSVDADDISTITTTQTAIPNMKHGESWRYETIDEVSALDTYAWERATTEHTGDMLAWYKDLCVAPVPQELGGGYLMIAVRGRVLVEQIVAEYAYVGALASAPGTLAPFASNFHTPGRAIVDLVVWWSSDPYWAGDTTVGPFLLVHSLMGLRDPYLRDTGAAETTAAFRCWLGVPGACFVGTDLFVYFVADATLDSAAAPWLDPATDLSTCIAAFDGGNGFTEATVFRKISGDTVRDCIINGTPTAELDWTTDDELPGECSLPIRTFLAKEGSATFEVQELPAACLEAALDAYNAGLAKKQEYARVVDPMPLSGGSDVQLFIALRPLYENDLEADLNLLFGVWHLAGIDDGQVLLVDHGTSVESVETEFGRDFVGACFSPPGEGSRDQVDWGRTDDETGTSHDFMDPDVVADEVEELMDVLTNDQNALVVYEGPVGIALRDWRAAWDPDPRAPKWATLPTAPRPADQRPKLRKARKGREEP